MMLTYISHTYPRQSFLYDQPKTHKVFKVPSFFIVNEILHSKHRDPYYTMINYNIMLHKKSYMLHWWLSSVQIHCIGTYLCYKSQDIKSSRILLFLELKRLFDSIIAYWSVKKNFYSYISCLKIHVYIFLQLMPQHFEYFYESHLRN